MKHRNNFIKVFLIFSLVFVITVFPFISGSALSASDYIPSCPAYPQSSLLPYGEDTQVLYFVNGSTKHWYFFAFYDLTASSDIAYQVYVTSAGKVQITSDVPIRHVYGSTTFTNTTVGSMSAAIYSYTSANTTFSAANSVCCTHAFLYLGVDATAQITPKSYTVRAYPSDSYEAYISISNQLDEIQNGNQEIVTRIQQGNAEIQSQAAQNKAEINSNVAREAQSAAQAVNEAGSDQPSLDTSADWMEEVLENVNSWVESVQDFGDSLETAGEDVREYITQGSTMFNRFLTVCQASAPVIYAFIVFLLVFIVVRKLVGR